jgi:hypothetical protein
MKYLRAKLITKGIKQLAYNAEPCPDSLQTVSRWNKRIWLSKF